MTDVVFLTNRRLDGAPEDEAAYSGEPGPQLLTGLATVTPPRGRKSGSITAIAATAAGALHADAAHRIAEAGHVYFFVHGFANSFPEAITRAAFNRDWYAQEGGPAKDALAVTFTWPSPGKVFGDAAPPSDPELAVQDLKLKPFGLPGTGAYFADRKRAADSIDLIHAN